MSDIRLAISAAEAAKRVLDEVGGWDAKASYSRWKTRRQAAEAAARIGLEAAGAKVKGDWQGATIAFAGIRATSSGGIGQAIDNWLRRARIHGDANG